MVRNRLAWAVVFLAVVASPAPVAARPRCTGKGACDTVAPAVSVGSPAAGAVVAGRVSVSGTASDNVSLSRVEVAVDGGAFATASGTTAWSWSWDSATVADGAHSVTARAVDAAGNRSTASVSVTVRNGTADATSPSVSVASPASGSVVAGTVAVSGAASDNASVARVETAVDGGPWVVAAGTTSWSWSWDTAGSADGSHTVTARAVDAAGNQSTTSVTVTVRNASADATRPAVSITAPAAGATVSGTTSVTGTSSDDVGVTGVAVSVDGGAYGPATGTVSWSWSWNTAGLASGYHTLTARATDAAGNTATASVTVNVASTTYSSAPSSQGAWTSPEGARIEVASAGPWTIAGVYQLLKDNAAAPGDFARIAPTLTVKVQDTYASQAVTGVNGFPGSYSDFTATIYLKGVNSTFATKPDFQMAHEYGHAWTLFHLYTTRQGDWGPYLNARWSSADGSTTLATDSRLDSSYTWSRSEIVADDYRLLFGTAAAVAGGNHLNSSIPDPRNVPGLRTFLLTRWAA